MPGLNNSDLATPSLLALPIIPTTLAIIVMTSITAAAITTIDSVLLTLASMWSRDVHKGFVNPKASEASQLRVGRLIIPLMTIIAGVFAWWAAGQTGLSFMIAPLASAASAGLLMVVPAIFGAFFWRRATAAGAIVSCVLGAATVLLFQVTGWKPLGWWPAIWGFSVCVPLFIIVSLLTKPPKEKAAEFIGYLKEELKKGNFL